LDFFENFDDANAKLEVIACIKDRVVDMVHTRDGALVCMRCIWFGTVKDRKSVLKSLKGLVQKISCEEYGHLLLLAIFDAVDDTVLVDSIILKEIRKHLSEILANKFGIRVILYLLSPRDSRHFNKQCVAMLSIGDNNTTSKKSLKTKHDELLEHISTDLLNFASDNVKNMMLEAPHFPLLFNTICQKCVGDKVPVFKALCDVMREEFIPGNMENLHIVEHPRGHYCLSHLLKYDRDSSQTTLSSIMIEQLDETILGSWLSCNKGAFILVSMMENGAKDVQQVVKRCVLKNKKKLMKYTFKGSSILLQKCNFD